MLGWILSVHPKPLQCPSRSRPNRLSRREGLNGGVASCRPRTRAASESRLLLHCLARARGQDSQQQALLQQKMPSCFLVRGPDRIHTGSCQSASCVSVCCLLYIYMCLCVLVDSVPPNYVCYGAVRLSSPGSGNPLSLLQRLEVWMMMTSKAS